MAVRTKVLGYGQQAVAGTYLAYTCPAGETAIVKEALLYRGTTGAAGSVQLRLGAVGLPSTPLWVATLNAGESIRLELWTVMVPTNTLSVTVVGNGPVNWWISGTELAGVA